jgi:hypothetical protein
MHIVFTEIGENASIQRQPITPLTPTIVGIFRLALKRFG